MYVIRSETFIKTDLLQHLEISRQTYPMNRSKIILGNPEADSGGERKSKQAEKYGTKEK